MPTCFLVEANFLVETELCSEIVNSASTKKPNAPSKDQLDNLQTVASDEDKNLRYERVDREKETWGSFLSFLVCESYF